MKLITSTCGVRYKIEHLRKYNECNNVIAFL